MTSPIGSRVWDRYVPPEAEPPAGRPFFFYMSSWCLFSRHRLQDGHGGWQALCFAGPQTTPGKKPRSRCTGTLMWGALARSACVGH